MRGISAGYQGSPEPGWRWFYRKAVAYKGNTEARLTVTDTIMWVGRSSPSLDISNISLITSEALASQLRDGMYSIVDARFAHEFADGHIPGAINLSWEDWCEMPPSECRPILTEPGYWGVLAHPLKEGLAHRLSSVGLSNDRPIIVYADGVRSKGREGRIAWMLLYLGAAKVYLLNKGWSDWLEAGGNVEVDIAQTRNPRSFLLALDERRRATSIDLHALYQKSAFPLMIDTRSASEFQGYCYEYQPRKGRLPGSLLLPFDDLFDNSGSYISSERYAERLPLEAKQAKLIVPYCEVGVRAALFALLHECYTGQVLPVFDGSIMEWGYRADFPLVTPVLDC